VIGQNGNAPWLHLGEELRAISLAVKHQREAALARIIAQALLKFVTGERIGFQPGRQIAAERGQQSWIDFLVDQQERLPVHGAEPGEQLIQ